MSAGRGFATADGLQRHHRRHRGLGMLYLNRGEFAGKHILAPELIGRGNTPPYFKNRADAEYPTLDHPVLADDSVDIDPTSDWGMGYGWQFWRCIPEGIYRGDGALGQFCIVMPRQDAVLAITAGTDDIRGILPRCGTGCCPVRRHPIGRGTSRSLMSCSPGCRCRRRRARAGCPQLPI